MFWSQKRVLITGANGFVGPWLAEPLLRAGATVVGLVRDHDPHGGLYLQGLADSVIIATGDVTDGPFVFRLLNEYEIDTCFHLAAQSLVPVAGRNPISTFESNIRGTWTLLEQCRLSGGVRRVVVSTSDKVYGHQDGARLSEDAQLKGRFPYDVSKTCADIISRMYAEVFGVPVAVVRCANIYGGGDLNWSRIVPYTVRCMLEETPVVLRSSGQNRREYVYVEDAVAGFLAVGSNLHRAEVAGEAFNCGSDVSVDVRSIVKMILDLGGQSALEVIAQSGWIGSEIQEQALDSAKASRVLGWRPATGLREGLEKTIRWYRLNLETAKGQPLFRSAGVSR